MAVARVLLTLSLSLVLALAGCGDDTSGTDAGAVDGGVEAGSGDGPGDGPGDCTPQTTRSCYSGPTGTEGVGTCKAGTQTCSAAGSWGSCQGEVVPSPERCTLSDNDCDGQADEDDVCLYALETSSALPAGARQLSFSEDGQRGLAVGDGGAIWTSSDAGESWVARPSGTTQRLRQGLIIPGDVLLVVGDGGTVLRSIDDGASWQARSSKTSKDLHALALGRTMVVAVGDDGAIIRSPDVGSSWSLGSPAKGDSFRAIVGLEQSFIAVGVGGAIQRSTDNAATWADVSANSTATLLAVTHGSGASSYMAVGEKGVVLFSQSGTSWSVINSGAATSETLTTVLSPGKKTFVVGSDVGFYISHDDGGSWTRRATASNEGWAWRTETELWSLGTSPQRYAGLLQLRFPAAHSPEGFQDLVFSNENVSGGDTVAIAVANSIWRSTDGGQQWRRVHTPTLSGTYFGVSRHGSRVVAVGPGVLFSSDGGRSFTPAVINGKRGTLFDVSLSGNVGIAVGTAATILRTQDGGATWQNINTGSLTYRSVSLKGSIGLIVGNSGQIMRSTDAGKTWKQVSSGTTSNLRGVFRYRESPSPLIGYACAVGVDGVILRSTNEGASWTKVASGTTKWLNDCAINGGSGVTFLASGNGVLLRSSDAGQTFEQLKRPSVANLNAVAMKYLSSEVLVASATRGGTLHSTDRGATFGDRTTAFHRLVSSPSGAVAIGSHGLRGTTSDGERFIAHQELAPAPGPLNAIASGSQALVVVGHEVIQRSVDSGGSWTTIPGQANRLYKDVAFAGGGTFLAVRSSTAQRSTNQGVTWTAVVGADDMEAIDCRGPVCVAVGDSGTASRTTDAGKTWKALNLGTSWPLQDVAFGATPGQVIAVGNADTLLVSSDDGATWTPASLPISLPSTNLFGAFSLGVPGQFLVTSGDGHVIATVDGGASWRLYSPALNGMFFTDSTVLGSNQQRLFVEAKGRHARWVTP